MMIIMIIVLLGRKPIQTPARHLYNIELIHCLSCRVMLFVPPPLWLANCVHYMEEA